MQKVETYKIIDIEPLSAKLEFDFELGIIYLIDELGNVEILKGKIWKEYLEDLKVLYDTYTKESDESLTEDAQGLKRELIKKIKIEI